MPDTIDRLTTYYQGFIGLSLLEAQTKTCRDFSEPAQAGLDRVQAGIDATGNVVCFRLTLKSGVTGEVTQDGFTTD